MSAKPHMSTSWTSARRLGKSLPQIKIKLATHSLSRSAFPRLRAAKDLQMFGRRAFLPGSTKDHIKILRPPIGNFMIIAMTSRILLYWLSPTSGAFRFTSVGTLPSPAYMNSNLSICSAMSLPRRAPFLRKTSCERYFETQSNLNRSESLKRSQAKLHCDFRNWPNDWR